MRMPEFQIICLFNTYKFQTMYVLMSRYFYLNIPLFHEGQIEELIDSNRLEELKTLSEECGIALEDVDKTVTPIIESCTKDAILVIIGVNLL